MPKRYQSFRRLDMMHQAEDNTSVGVPQRLVEQGAQVLGSQGGLHCADRGHQPIA